MERIGLMVQNKNIKMDINLVFVDKVIEIFSSLLLIVILSVPFIYWSNIPERIPVHFNFMGEPDSYGSKYMLFLIPGFSLFVFLLLTIVNLFPHTFNYPVKINDSNRETLYRIATKTIRIIKAIILSFFLFISLIIVRVADGSMQGFGPFPLIIFLITLLSVVGYSIKISLKYKGLKNKSL